MQAAIKAELHAEHAKYLAAVDEGVGGDSVVNEETTATATEEAIACEAATSQAAVDENHSVENEETVITRVRSTIEMEVMRS